MLTENFFDTGTVKINYAEGPPSGKALVMLNGVTGMWQQFLPIMPWCLMRYHTFALDLRGHGHSNRTPGAYLVSNHAADVSAFLHHIAIKPAILLGWSLGAIVALQVAAQAPELVRALVLEDPPLVMMTDNEPAKAKIRAGFRTMEKVMTMEGTTADKRAAFANLRTDLDDVQLRARFNQLTHFDPAYFPTITEERLAESIRLEDVLPKVTCPVLLMQAEMGIIDEQTLQSTLPLLTDCAHIHMPGVGHSMHLEQPAQFARIVMDFLESL